MAIPYPTKSRTWSTTTPNSGDYIDDEIDQIYANDNYLAGFIGENDLSHGLRNAKFTLSGTTLTLTTQSGAIGASNSIRIAVPLASGTLQWLNISAALTMELPTGTFSERIMGLTNLDGSATLTLAGSATDVVLFAYVVYDTNTPYLMVSRSPFHYKMPSNYYHTPSATGMTRVGAAAPSTWDAAIISKAGALTDANSPCVCIGPMVYTTISGTDGRFSSMNLVVGEFPKWNNRKDPYLYDGTNVFRHEVVCDTGNLGHGSTDTRIIKLTNNTIAKGYAIQYLPVGGTVASGGIGGAEFVVNEPGFYECVFSATTADPSVDIGLSVNSTQRTTSITGISVATRLAIDACVISQWATVTRTKFFAAGDVIRPHGSGANVDGALLSIVKLGWGPG